MGDRELFETYILTERGNAYLLRDENGYSDHFVQEAWEAWEAARLVYGAQPAPETRTDEPVAFIGGKSGTSGEHP